MKTIMRVRTIGPVVAVLIATFLLLAFQHRAVGATPRAAESHPLTLGSPNAAAHLTRDLVLSIAKNSDWKSYLQQGVIQSVDFGSMDVGFVDSTAEGQIRHRPARYVWAIRISGINDAPSLPAPVPGESPKALKPMQYMTIIVDDTTGAVLRVHED